MIKGNNSYDESFNYLFAAIRGIQAGREYYIAMCPLRIVPKIFLFDEDELSPELRAQRTLNHVRIPEIANYLVNNPKDYVFSSITASIDGNVRFNPYGDSGIESKMGTLIVPMTAQFIVNDGQHRRAAIEEALKLKPEIGSETMSVVFFIDSGLKRAQQMFADLNQHAVRPTKSLGILYNNRDPLSRLSLQIAKTSIPFKNFTEFEKSSISNRSIKLFTLSSIYQATMELLGKSKKDSDVSEADEKIVSEYWAEVTSNIPEWQLLMQRKVNSSELRRDYVHAHGVALHALGIVGNALMKQYPSDWKLKIKMLENVDWSRSNSNLWEGRATIGGSISKARVNLILTTNLLKQILDLELKPSEEQVEKKFQESKEE